MGGMGCAYMGCEYLEPGRNVADLCREHGISEATLHRWKSQFGGLQPGDDARLRELEDENRRLKSLLVDQQLHYQALKEDMAT